MPRTKDPAVRHVGAVRRALEVIDALADETTDLGTNEIARRTGINASTVSRLLATLVEGGLVERVEESGRYRLGPRLLSLGATVLDRLDLRRVAAPHLEAQERDIEAAQRGYPPLVLGRHGGGDSLRGRGGHEALRSYWAGT